MRSPWAAEGGAAQGPFAYRGGLLSLENQRTSGGRPPRDHSHIIKIRFAAKQNNASVTANREETT
jgi:hypothetical protein